MIMKHSISHQEYFKYLSKRSILGVLYRRYRLYPMLCRYLKGNVLDYGCGIGDFLKYHENSIGIDITIGMFKRCGKQDHLIF